MPLIEFRCEDCGAEFDELVKPGASPTCPSCASSATTRRWSQVAPTPKLGLRGKAAKRSDAARRERDAARKQRRVG